MQAIAAAEAVLAIECELVGEGHPDTTGTRAWLIERYLEAEDFVAARAAQDQQTAILEVLYGAGNWRVADARWLRAHVDVLAKLSAADRAALVAASAQENEGVVAYHRGDYARAAAVALEVLDVRRRILPDPHSELAKSLNNLGLIRHAQSKFEQAHVDFEQALAIYQRLFPSERYAAGHPDIATCLGNLGILSHATGDYQRAREYHEQALAIYQRAYTSDDYPQGHPDLAKSLNNLGILLDTMGDHSGAREYYERVIGMYGLLYPAEQYPQGHPNWAMALNNLGALLESQGDYIAAELHHRRALAMYEGLYCADEYAYGHPDFARSLNNLGHLLQLQGSYAAAREYYERALVMRRRLYPADAYPVGHPDLAISLSSLGYLLLAQGDLAGAGEYFQQSLAMLTRLYPADEYPQGHPLLAGNLNNLGYVHYSLTEYEKALACYEQALAMRERLYPADVYPRGHAELAMCLNNLGALFEIRQEYAKAQAYLERALDMRRRLYPDTEYGDGHPRIAESLNNMGVLLIGQGELKQARRYLEEALAMRERLFAEDIYPRGHPELAANLTNLGILLVSTDHPSQAIELLARAEQMQRDGLQDFFSLSSADLLSQFLDARSAIMDGLIALASENESALELAYRAVLGRKAAVLDALIRRREIERLAAADPVIALRGSELRTTRQQLAALALQPLTPETAQRRAELAAEARAVENALLRAMNQATSDNPAHPQNLDARSLTEQLERGTALIEVVRYRPYDFAARGDEPRWLSPRYTAFVLRGAEADVAPALLDLGEAEVIDTAVAELRAAVIDAGRQLAFASEEALVEQYREVAQPLSAAVFAPLEEHLDGVETIYLAPDGELTRVPFEALVDSESEYLIDRYAFAYLSSGGDLLRANHEPAEGTIVFAAPDYNLDGELAIASDTLLAQVTRSTTDVWQGELAPGTRGLTWNELPATEAEAAQIASLLGLDETYGPVQSFLGPEALEGVLKRIAAPRLLHLATHGFYLPVPQSEPSEDLLGATASMTTAGRLARLGADENPLLRSGVVLAGANRGDETDDVAAASNDDGQPVPDDGWVTAEEIGLLDLAGTELVVLSACETGLGDVRTGEGVSGLRRALIYAGAETLITSLYKVPDEATQALMAAFYTRLAAGEGKLAALRDAQRDIIAARRDEYGAAHPFFWASFVLVGNPD